ncbi:MAG: CRTAC1 family protein [Bryobacterales bacterium]|nr:CRTAC1 family protein [Bryobacterales bacterium]
MVTIFGVAAVAGLIVASSSPIHFVYKPIAFQLENSETSRRYAPETMAGGIAVFDYDNDGDLDIFFTNGADILTLRKNGPKYSNRLFANDGKSNFTDVTAKARLTGTGFDVGVAIADYDNDGFQDIFVGGLHRNTLYHNNGDGTFTDVTEKSGISGESADWSVGGAWLDFNNDGLLDLFIANYMLWDKDTEPLCQAEGHAEYCHPRFYKPLTNQLFINKGNGIFRDASAETGVAAHLGKAMGAAVADYDGDGWPDIFVTNDKLYNFLFHNLGGKKVEEVGFESGVGLAENGNPISGMGADFRDVDNDGFPDIIFVALDNETFPLYRNTGKGTFRDITSKSGMSTLSRPMAGYGAGFYDLDNDGWKDIFVTRGHVQSPLMRQRYVIDQNNSVFRNVSGVKFEALTAEAGLDGAPPKRHRGSGWGDFNGDGRIDVVVSALSAPAEIWMNDSPGANHWIDIKLEGTKSNRDGTGAIVKVAAKKGIQYNHATTSVGYASSSAGPVHFGLGSEKVASLIEIRWPSGKVQKLANVDGDRVLRVKEPL